LRKHRALGPTGRFRGIDIISALKDGKMREKNLAKSPPSRASGFFCLGAISQKVNLFQRRGISVSFQEEYLLVSNLDE
jgi:hypothetical protein